MRRGGPSGRSSGRDQSGPRRGSYDRTNVRTNQTNEPVDNRRGDQRPYNRIPVNTQVVRSGTRPPVSRSRSPLRVDARRTSVRSHSPPPRHGPPEYINREQHLQSHFSPPFHPPPPRPWNSAGRGSTFSDRPRMQGAGQPSGGVYVGNGYPFFMDQSPPEENPGASRTLFVGNIDENLSPDDIKQVFENFGIVEEVRLKDRQAEGGGPGRPFAFVRFFNLNQAYVAKMEMSGKHIGRYRCRIGYGKAMATNCVWIGGLGAWISKQDLEREFSRFGRMVRVVWPGGHDYAYVVYDSVEPARRAVEQMRGFCFRGTSVRLRTDFSDENQIDNPPPGLHVVRRPPFEHRAPHQEGENHFKDVDAGSEGHRRGGSMSGSESRSENSSTTSRKRQHSGSNTGSQNRKKRGSMESKPESNKTGGGGGDKAHVTKKLGRFRALEINLDKVHTISDVTDCLPVVWTGQVMIKKQCFLTKMHRVTGRSDLVDDLLLDDSGVEPPSLKITQRIRMEESKLEEVHRKITKAGPDGWSILVGVPEEVVEGNGRDETNGASSVKQSSFADLVLYLREKKATGVLSLPPGCAPGDEMGLLHIFPSCEFVHRYLLQRAPQFTMDYEASDYVVVFLVSV